MTALPFLDRFSAHSTRVTDDEYRGLVLRDAEELLNTRLSSPFGEGNEAAYGLADLTVCGHTEGELMNAARQIQNCLSAYEPRLSDIRVEPGPIDPASPDTFSVSIEAALTGFPKAPPLSLDFRVPLWNKV